MAATILNSPRAVEMSVEVYRAIRALMAPVATKSRPIGFTADLGKDTYIFQPGITWLTP